LARRLHSTKTSLRGDATAAPLYFFQQRKASSMSFSVTTEERKGQIGHEHIPEYECNATSIRKRNANMEIARKVAHL
jgi:hypothetical protein